MHHLSCCHLRKLSFVLISKSIVLLVLIMEILIFMNKQITEINEFVEFGITYLNLSGVAKKLDT